MGEGMWARACELTWARGCGRGHAGEDMRSKARTDTKTHSSCTFDIPPHVLLISTPVLASYPAALFDLGLELN